MDDELDKKKSDKTTGVRSSELTSFLVTLHSAIKDSKQISTEANRVVVNIMEALQVEAKSVQPEPCWLPTCDYIQMAIEQVTTAAGHHRHTNQQSSGSSVVNHVHALNELAPKLSWWHRDADDTINTQFSTGHANTTVIGKGGLEEREDVWVGISLMAPGIEYPEHHHPPEEVYLVLSPGYWQQDGGGWFEPGIGRVVHNTSNIRHAMRSASEPLLATWCLWKGERA